MSTGTVHRIGRAVDFPPGTHRIVTVDGRELGVVNVGGHYYALLNRCLHQGGPVCRGRLGAALGATEESDWRPRWEQDGEVIRCPWHQLEFNVTTGRCLAYPHRRIATFEVAVVDGEIRVTV